MIMELCRTDRDRVRVLLRIPTAVIGHERFLHKVTNFMTSTILF